MWMRGSPGPRLSQSALAIATLFGAVPLSAAADTVVVGQLRSKAQTAIPGSSSALTLVDLANPAAISGQITTVTVQWVGGGVNPCSPGFKVKFFRPSSSGGRLAFLDERGPFASLRGLLVVPIAPSCVTPIPSPSNRAT